MLIKSVILTLLILPSLAYSQFEKKHPEGSFIYFGVSYNPFNNDCEDLSLLLTGRENTNIKGTINIMAGANIFNNFDNKFGYYLNVPFYYYLFNEDLPKLSKPKNADDNDELLGEKYIFGGAIGIGLTYLFNDNTLTYLGLESNYLFGDRYYKTNNNITYTDKMSFMVIPTAFIGIRFNAVDVSWNFFQGITVKAGMPFKKSIFKN